MENRETTLKKIEKLLALAAKNPNEHEAIAAALKAQELMAKYNIKLADVQDEGQKGEMFKAIYEASNKHEMKKWKIGLAGIIAKNFCCEHYFMGGNNVVFYGYKKDAQIALEVFRFLYETGNKLAVRYYHKCKKEGRETRGIMNTYLVGFREGVKEVLDKQCTALMIVVPKEVTESFKEMTTGPGWGNISSKLSMSGDGRAYASGKEDGKTAASARAIEA